MYFALPLIAKLKKVELLATWLEASHEIVPLDFSKPASMMLSTIILPKDGRDEFL